MSLELLDTETRPSSGSQTSARAGVGAPADEGFDEPISPELVLVDPELARVARARLPLTPYRPSPRRAQPRDDAWLARLRHAEPVAVPEREETPEPRRYAAVVAWIVVGAVAAAALVAISVYPRGSETKFLPAPPAGERPAPTAAPTAAPVRPQQPGKKASPAVGTAARSPTRAEPPVAPSRAQRALAERAERRILALLPEAPRRDVPSALVDRRLGLVRTNVHVSCRANARANRAICIVRAPGGRAGRLRVKYRVSRRGERVVWGARRLRHSSRAAKRAR